MNAREWIEAGDEHAKQGSTDAAIDAYRNAAKIYREQDFPLKAYAVCKQILMLDPTHADSRTEKAELAKHLGIDSDE